MAQLSQRQNMINLYYRIYEIDSFNSVKKKSLIPKIEQ